MPVSNDLEEFKKDATQITKEGFHFKPFKSVVNGKVNIKPGLAYKKGKLKGYIQHDFLSDDFRIYVEHSWKF